MGISLTTEDRLRDVLVRMFPLLGAEAIADVAGRMDWVRLRRNDVLFRQGDPGDSLCILVAGRLRVIARSPCGTREVLNELASGDSVGEMALITGEPRNADVAAVRDCLLARLPREAFQSIVQQRPEILMGLAQVLIRWLKNKERPVAGTSRVRTIALVGSETTVCLEDLARELGTVMSHLGSVLHLRGAQIEAMFGRSGTATSPEDDRLPTPLTTWFDQQEASHEYILLQGDQSPSSWTQFCLRQADVVLVVVPWDGGQSPGAMERDLLHPEADLTSARRWLVLLHRNGERLPAGSSAYLNCRAVDGHCHVRLDVPADVARLARIITERSVGLVLSGGGARGLAHIGVIDALVEAGVPIDLIGGTSMGAIIGAMYAMGLEREEIVRLNKKVWLDVQPFRSYTLPIVSLFGGRKFDHIARLICRGTEIEDLWVNYFCVSSNLSSAEPVVHRSGLLWRAVRASASLPGMVPPVVDDGRVLVDGGVLNNLPCDVMREWHCGRVVAVNVSPDVRLTATCREMPTPWRMLWSRIRSPRGPAEAPNILAILESMSLLPSRGKVQAVLEDADFRLEPPVSRFPMLGFEAIDEIVRIGYEHTVEQMESLRASIC